MRQGLSWLPRLPRKRTVYTIAFSAAILGIHNSRKILRNDSQSTAQWPSSPAQVDRRKPGSAGKREDSRKSVESADEDVSLFEDEDTAAWENFSSRFALARSSVAAIQWADLGDKIADKVMPEWVQQLPAYIEKLQDEMEVKPGSLADEIWQEARDPFVHPEIQWNAKVRIGKDLCPEELAFIRRRKRYTTQALAKYLNIPENTVDPRDVPTIAICGSGGGLRALVAGAASYLNAQEAGLFGCATYTAGVSGSCWLQTLYNSSIGRCDHGRIIDHLKKRIGTHIAYPPAFLELLTRAPTNKFIMSGTIERLKGDSRTDFGIVDVYGLLLATRLMIPRDELSVYDHDLKLSKQQDYLTLGAHPLPIYSAVRHEIPLAEVKSKTEVAKDAIKESVEEKAQKEAWFEWFEFTPYETFCEGWDAGIPTWSCGRHFEGGRSVSGENQWNIPELRIPFLMGIWGSAFCATLAHYYKEIRPVVKELAGFAGVDELLEEKNDELLKVHPIEPGGMPNFALGLENQLASTCPKGIFNMEDLDLMDAGMSNNLPLYPLLRQGRDVDIIVCFDASADIREENWLSVAEGYAKRRGIKGWPVGAGWPKKDTSEREMTKELEAASAASAKQAAGKVAEAREASKEAKLAATKAKDEHGERNDQDKEQGTAHGDWETDLGYCNVWVGTTLEREDGEEPSESKRVDPDAHWKLMQPDAGITVIYFPFLPNPQVKGVDPNSSPFMNTFNFIYTPEQIDKVVALAKANFEEGKEQTKRTVRAVYERKKASRLQQEETAKRKRLQRQVREGGDHFQ